MKGNIISANRVLFALLLAFLTACCPVKQVVGLHYNKDGKFKIVQIADTHVIPENANSAITLKNLEVVLDAEKPDFVIHTGDIVYGRPASEAAHLVFDNLVRRGIPFAVTLGNHDGEFDLSREELLNLICSFDGCVNKGKDNILTLSGPDGLDRVFYLFDSGNRDEIAGVNGWGYIHAPQIDWYRKASNYFKRRNRGEIVPSMAFFHIPVPEYNEALHSDSRELTGHVGEEPCSPSFNSGLYLTFREQGDVQAICTGHDHNNDFVIRWQDFYFIYGRYTCFDNIYGDLQPSGVRVFEFTLGEKGFRTWIRLSDGSIEQEQYLQTP
jgi:3',5'-cyclic AMP phosphodiesterase CpdA